MTSHKSQYDQVFEDIKDAAHENAYMCAICDAFDTLKEMGMSSGMLVEFADKMVHFAEVRQATKFTLTK